MPIPSSKAKTQAKPQTKPASAQPKPAPAIAPKPVLAIAPKPLPAVIVFGVDQAKKPTAASFTADQVELARKAADLMKLHVIPVDGPELTELAAKLPAGRIYASGHAFVPPAKLNIYDRIADLADPPPPLGLPRSWDDIDVGHQVLAQERPGEGWWETIVVAKDNDMLTLAWRNFPSYPRLVCHRTAVALQKPAAADA
jgi:hypothetical protein